MYGHGDCNIPAGWNLFFPKKNWWEPFQWKILKEPIKPGYSLSNHYYAHVFTKPGTCNDDVDDNHPLVVPGCGTWHPISEKEFTPFDEIENPSVFLKRWKWSMIEYTINPDAHGITGDAAADYLLCILNRVADYVIDLNKRDHPDSVDSGGAGEPPEQLGQSVRRNLRIRGHNYHPQRHMRFYTRCLVQNEDGLLTIDGGMVYNYASRVS
ncbi:OLC1v1035292C1 [Oldenlandia corymbosa var. corymbosa]|uniref:OLC1v1035292C1 n=1 Tax=Oldenlandia corymbosa var. corymbosa TaxID=529605 RepID=A0AAV1CTY6_OLDCO|nr:OLC1v1035292C1 [Oldenlandia corymbosa var. corymbosa]